jgi:signal peptidase I
MTKKRNLFLAALATLMTNGLGQLYNGKPGKALIAYVLWLACGAFAVLAPLSSSLAWLLAAALMSVFLSVILIIDAVRDARKTKEFVLRRYNRWYVYLGVIIVQLFLVMPCFEKLVLSSIKAFSLPSVSMEPTLHVGDRLVVDTKAYDPRAPQRGDIVVIKYPQNESIVYLKRVIGLPGENIEIMGRVVLINGQPLKEPYVKFMTPESIYDHYGPIPLPKDKYFLLGDNRDNSQDSRFWGSVDRAKFVGQVRYLYWAKNKSRIGKQFAF